MMTESWLSSMVAISHMWLFKFNSKLINIKNQFFSPIALATSHVLNRNMWMVSARLDSNI